MPGPGFPTPESFGVSPGGNASHQGRAFRAHEAPTFP